LIFMGISVISHTVVLCYIVHNVVNRGIEMKVQFKSLVAVTALASSLAMSGAALAESTYGYNAAGAGPVTATAKVKVTVNVPLLILLRVGSAGAVVDNVVLQAAFGGSAGLPATLTAGNSQAASWDGTAPTGTLTATPTNLTAYAWTNAAAGGSLNGAVTTPFAGTILGLTAAAITVTGTPVSGGGLAHPGANTGTFAAVSFAHNTLVSSTWAYGISAATLATLGAGSDAETITYTATTL
jgi:hypothetical protein